MTSPSNHLRTLLYAALAAYRPTSARLVLIRGWFGPRWLRFEGKLRGELACWSRTGAVVPPFHPGRIIAELDLVPGSESPRCWGERPASVLLHGHRTSEANVRDHALSPVPPGGLLAAWLSEPRPPSPRAALMVYLVRPDDQPTQWYVQADGEVDPPTLVPAGITPHELDWFLGRARSVAPA